LSVRQRCDFAASFARRRKTEKHRLSLLSHDHFQAVSATLTVIGIAGSKKAQVYRARQEAEAKDDG
jgi:hypothetical protein